MPFSHREFNAFIHANEFCRLLYDFLEDNQDQALYMKTTMTYLPSCMKPIV